MIIDDSAVVRNVITAFGWLLGGDQRIKAFPGNDVEEAVQWLGVSVDLGRVRATLERLRLSLWTAPAKKSSR